MSLASPQLHSYLFASQLAHRYPCDFAFYVADPSAPFTHSYTRALLPSDFPSMSLFPFAPLLGLAEAGEDRVYGT